MTNTEKIREALLTENEVLRKEYEDFKNYILFYLPKYDFSVIDGGMQVYVDSDEYFAHVSALREEYDKLRTEFIKGLAGKDTTETCNTIYEFREMGSVVEKLLENVCKLASVSKNIA